MTTVKYVKQMNRAFDNENGYQISSRDINNMKQRNSATTYGEVTEQGLNDMLKGIRKKDKVFADLGSGTGRSVICAALNFNFSRCIGVEMSRDRFRMSQRILKDMKGGSKTVQNKLQKVRFINSDARDIDISDMDVIFISNLCFNDQLNTDICRKIESEKQGRLDVFCSAELPTTVGRIKRKFNVEMSWMNDSEIYHYTF
jgi:SAM-dependent methyltransferase